MPEDISIRELRGSNQAARVAPIKRMETELVLEDVLTANPELIAPDFTLVGRQTPVDGGSLDLLGVDGDGRLVVLQLKRAKLTREAVAQIIDYGSYLECLADSELAELMVDRSRTNGVDKIGDFRVLVRRAARCANGCVAAVANGARRPRRRYPGAPNGHPARAWRGHLSVDVPCVRPRRGDPSDQTG